MNGIWGVGNKCQDCSNVSELNFSLKAQGACLLSKRSRNPAPFIDKPQNLRESFSMYLKKISFGGTAAIITNMALITGLQTASASKKSIIASLLIIAIADNLTDSLSVHLYQESEEMEPRAAFSVTVSNYFTRLVVSLSFIALVAVLELPLAILCNLGVGNFSSLLTDFFTRPNSAAFESGKKS